MNVKLYLLLPLIILVASSLVNTSQQADAERQHAFSFSSHINRGIPGQGAAFNTWQGSGNFGDASLQGKGFASATFNNRGEKTELRMAFTLSEPYELSPSKNQLVMKAVVESSSMPSFPVGAVFNLQITKGDGARDGSVCYFLPSESGCQSPATVVIN